MVQAATKTWGTVPANTWDTGTTPAWNANAATWAGDDDALFNNGIANTVSVSGTAQANSITQSTTGTVTTISGGTIQLDAATGIVNSSASALSISSGVLLNNSITINVGTTSPIILSGAISESSGPRSITKTGSAALTLSGVNAYTGTTTVTAGLISMTAGTSASSAATVSGNATAVNALDLAFDNRLASLTLTNGDNRTTFNGLRVIGATANNTNNSADTITGALTISGVAGINVQAEVAMTFIGIGVSEKPSWGRMITDSRLEILRGVWWEAAAASTAIFFVSYALNIVGDAMRDALGPKLHERS